MEWQAPAVVLDARPLGEGGAVVSLLTEAHGRHAGLARGGASRAQAPVWQAGNLVEARWVARLADQLGSLQCELVHPAAALAMDDPLSLALLLSACAVAEGALPDREPHPRHLPRPRLPHRPPANTRAPPPCCRTTSAGKPPCWPNSATASTSPAAPSPAAGRTCPTSPPKPAAPSSRAAAAPWADRLLPLPPFLLGSQAAPSGPAEWLAGLRLTGHFLGKDAFGHHHKPLPTARDLLFHRVAALAEADSTTPGEKGTDA